MRELIYSKYSNERNRSFAIRTDILEEDGVRCIQKCALYPEGKAHIAALKKHEEALNRLYGDAFCCNRILSEDGEHSGVTLEYVEGKNLEELLDELLGSGEQEQAQTLLEQYLDQLAAIHGQETFQYTDAFRQVFGDVRIDEKEAASSIMNIDMVCDNIIPGDMPQVLDYEWTFHFPVPCKFLLFRVIFYHMKDRRPKAGFSMEDCLKKYGITEELKKKFLQMEEAFQSYITAGHVPMRFMYADITPGVEYVDEMRETLKQLREEKQSLQAENASLNAILKDMRNTKIWKLYRKYRDFVERKKS